MAVDLGDFDDTFDGGMYFTAGGKQYRIPPVSAELGAWGRRASVLRTQVTDDTSEEEAKRIVGRIGEPPIPEGLTLNEALLSPDLYKQLVAAGADDELVKRLAQTVYYRIIGGDGLALAFARGEDPKAGNRAERRAAKKTPKVSGSRTTSTAKAATTRKAASGSPTRSPRKNAASGKASPGRKS